MTAPSGRWRWCAGCARWHKPRPVHLTRGGDNPVAPPRVTNFDGTEDELARFVIWQKLREEEDSLMERRIDARLDRGMTA